MYTFQLKSSKLTLSYVQIHTLLRVVGVAFRTSGVVSLTKCVIWIYFDRTNTTFNNDNDKAVIQPISPLMNISSESEWGPGSGEFYATCYHHILIHSKDWHTWVHNKNPSLQFTTGRKMSYSRPTNPILRFQKNSTWVYSMFHHVFLSNFGN